MAVIIGVMYVNINVDQRLFMMSLNRKLFEVAIILLSTVFLCNTVLLHAAADSKGFLQRTLTNFKSNPYFVATTAGVGALGGYALADYCDKLPAWMPSSGSALKDVKKFCIEHPGQAAFIGVPATFLIINSLMMLKTQKGIQDLQPIQKRIQDLQAIKTLLQVESDGRCALTAEQKRALSVDEAQELSYFFNQYSGVIPDDQQLPEVPASIITRCTSYLQPLPRYLHNIVQGAVQDVGIPSPVFFYQTSRTSHASSRIFNKVGFHLVEIAAYDPTYRSLLAEHGLEAKMKDDFIRALYHELCHIKGRHTEKDFWDLYNEKMRKLGAHKEVIWEKSGDGKIRREHCPNSAIRTCELCLKSERIRTSPYFQNRRTIYERYLEIEAELGAMYFLRRLHAISDDKIMDVNYPEDDGFHPTGEDQNRYNRKLLERLSANSELDYTVVQDLAKEYLIEKEPYFALLFEDKEELQPIAASSSNQQQV